MEQDEIYLADLWRLLQRQWRWFTGAGVLVIALAVGLISLARPQWEATAWIRIGQIGVLPSSEDAHAEPFQRVLDRMNRRPFQDAVLHDLGIDPKSSEGSLFRKSFQIYPSPYAGLVKIIVRGRSPRQAERFATATCDHLKSIHDDIERAPRQFAEARLEQARAQLADAVDERAHLRRLLADGKGPAAGGSDGAAVSIALVNVGQEVHGLEQAVADLSVRLSPSYTYATSMAWPVYVTDKPVSPHPVPLLGLSVIAALGVGFLVALARDALRRRHLAEVEPDAADPALTS